MLLAPWHIFQPNPAMCLATMAMAIANSWNTKLPSASRSESCREGAKQHSAAVSPSVMQSCN